MDPEHPASGHRGWHHLSVGTGAGLQGHHAADWT